MAFYLAITKIIINFASVKETTDINHFSPTASRISGIEMKKMYFTSKKSFLVEQNTDGTFLITKTSTMKPL